MLQRVSCLAADVSKLKSPSLPFRPARWAIRYYSHSRPEKRLRILFCGSDEFSITSLKAVYDYSQERDSNVASIDVAAKTDKRVGRGLKIVRPPPIKPAAQSLGLPIHQFDTFRGWNLPCDAKGESYINMVIAVSFGLLVPPRILGACQYGGLNVHPSMLPNLKGSAPIEHAIINGYRKTGITIQTLHPSKFDEGKIVMQTSSPGLDIPDPDRITSPQLREILAPLGAEMLADCLRNRLYLEPGTSPETKAMKDTLIHATKLSPASRHINFQAMTTRHILRLDRALGRLWVNLTADGEHNESRLVFPRGLEQVESQQLESFPTEFLEEILPGVPFGLVKHHEKIEDSEALLIIKGSDSGFVQVREMTVSGMKPGFALAAAARAGFMKEPTRVNDHKICVFNRILH